MPVLDFAKKEINAKIVYYGPGRSGKTTNLQYVHAKLKPTHKGELMTLSTEQDRTLFFDFLPVDLGEVKGMRTRFHLYTVPGQVFYSSTRKLVLKNTDGVVFVADSQRKYLNENVQSLNDLVENLKAHNREVKDLPIIIQYNKRDTADAMAVAELDRALNKHGFPTIQAVASRGEGVLQTLTLVSKLVVRQLRESTLDEKLPPLAAPRQPGSVPSPTASTTRTPTPGAGLDPEEEAALNRLDDLGPAPSPGLAKHPASAASAAPGGLELVRVNSPRVEGPGELRFTLELRDPATGKTYLAPVRLALDLLLPPK